MSGVCVYTYVAKVNSKVIAVLVKRAEYWSTYVVANCDKTEQEHCIYVVQPNLSFCLIVVY